MRVRVGFLTKISQILNTELNKREMNVCLTVLLSVKIMTCSRFYWAVDQ